MKIPLNDTSGWMPPTVDVPFYRWVYYKLTGKRPIPKIVSHKDNQSYSFEFGGSYDHYIKPGMRLRITRKDSDER